MPSSPDIANDAAATFAAYPELVTKIDAGTTVPDAELDQWIGATYPNFIDACVAQVNEVFTGQRAITGALRVGNAPATGWNGNANDIVVGDGTFGPGLTLYQPTTGLGGVWFRTSRSNNEGLFYYDANARCMVLGAGRDISTHANLELCGAASDGSLAPFSPGQSTDLGKSSGQWRDLWLKRHAYIAPATAPATPSSGAVLYVDSGTGDLVVKFSTGTTTVLASP